MLVDRADFEVFVIATDIFAVSIGFYFSASKLILIFSRHQRPKFRLRAPLQRSDPLRDGRVCRSRRSHASVFCAADVFGRNVFNSKSDINLASSRVTSSIAGFLADRSRRNSFRARDSPGAMITGSSIILPSTDRAQKFGGGVDDFLCEGDFFLRWTESIIDGCDLRGMYRPFPAKPIERAFFDSSADPLRHRYRCRPYPGTRCRPRRRPGQPEIAYTAKRPNSIRSSFGNQIDRAEA